MMENTEKNYDDTGKKKRQMEKVHELICKGSKWLWLLFTPLKGRI